MAETRWIVERISGTGATRAVFLEELPANTRPPTPPRPTKRAPRSSTAKADQMLHRAERGDV